MPKADEIILQLKADNKKLKSKLKESEKGVNKFSKSVGKMSGGFKALLTGAGIFAVIAGFKKLVQITDQQAKAEAQLNAVLKSTKNAAGLTAGEIKRMARELQQVTTFGDETILTAQNMLLTFTKIGKEVFPQATETVLNMAQAMGTDLKTQAIQVGKALNDPILGVTALRRVGVQLTAQQEKSIKGFVAVNDIAAAQKVILGELETQFGGVARSAATTIGGKFTQVANQVGDLVEGIGSDLTPEMKGLADAMFNASQDGGVLHKVLKVVSFVVKGAIKLVSNLINTLNRLFDDKLHARIKTGEEVINSVTNAIKLGIAMNKKKLDQMEAEEAPMDKIIAQRERILALESELAFNEGEAAKAKKKTTELLSKETKELDKNTESLNANKRAKDRVTPAADKKGKDPRLQEIELLRFLGEKELADKLALDVQKENLEKEHSDKINEIRIASDLKRRQIEQKFLEFRIRQGLTILSATSNMLSQIGQLLSMSSQNNIARLDQEQQARREEIENTIVDQTEREEALAALDEEFSRKKIAEQRKAAKIQKKIAIAETLIAIPQAAFAAFKSLAGIPIIGPALGAAAATAATLFGLKKVQLIKDQPLPVFQKGTVPSGVPGNHFPAMIGSDESVINGRSTSNNAELLDMINRNPQVSFSPIMTPPAVQSQTIVNIGPRTLYDQLADAVDNGELRISKVSI